MLVSYDYFCYCPIPSGSIKSIPSAGAVYALCISLYCGSNCIFEEVCYGITHPPRTWDPIYINFQYWKQLWDDAVAAPFLWDKIRLWFMPLGWRPRGLEPYTAENGRIGYTKSEQTKFYSKQFLYAKPYLIVQVLLGLAFLFVTINLEFPLEAQDRMMLSAGIFLMIISWGGILQARSWSILMEILRILVMGVSLIFVLDRVGIAHWTSWLTVFVALIAGVSILFISFFFSFDKLEELVPAP